MKVKLADVCACESSNLKQSDVINISGKYPVYGATGKIGYIDTYKQEKPYIAIVKDGAGVGRTYLCDSKSSVIGTLQYILPKENVLPEYLFYVIKHMHLEKYYSGATIPHIYFKNYKNEEFNLDSINNQETIINILNDCNKLINLRETQLQKYDDLIKARFVEMFGDPVSNSHALPKATLPELGEFGRGVSKHRPRNDPKLLGGKYPLIQTGDVASSDLYLKNYVSTYSELGLSQSKMWRKGTLCITIAANIAKTAILNFDACFPDSIVGFVANEKTNNIYIHYWFSFFQDVLEAQAPESAQKNINLKILSELKVICPPKKEQEQFSVFVQQVDKSKFLCFHQKKIREIFKVSRKLIFSLKFYSACRLWCEIIQYTVDTSNFMSNTLSNMNHNFMWNFSNSFCHNVNRAYCTNNTAPFKSTFTIFNTSRLSCFFRKYFNEFSTNDFSLSFWICNAC